MQNEDNYAMAPGNVDYPSDFVNAWHTIEIKEEENELWHNSFTICRKITYKDEQSY